MAKKPSAKKSTTRTASSASKKSAAKPKSAGTSASKSAKKPTAKKSASKGAGTTAKTAKKSAAKGASSTKSTKKQTANPRSAAKPSPSPAAKKSAAKATAAKSDAKAGAATAKKSAAKAAKAVQETAGAATAKKSAAKAAQANTAQSAGASAGDDKKKPQRKGITIVSKKPVKKPSGKKASDVNMPRIGAGLLGPGAKRRKPLIPSGPKAATSGQDDLGDDGGKKRKSPFNKRQLDRYRDILREKRHELLGDVSSFEQGALQSGSGGLSHTPQHIAEQGSDVQDQSLMLDLAAADRTLIREIDAALMRINDGTYGLCEVTGKPIGEDRLEELPWARYSIEAARIRERSALGR